MLTRPNNDTLKTQKKTEKTKREHSVGDFSKVTTRPPPHILIVCMDEHET